MAEELPGERIALRKVLMFFILALIGSVLITSMLMSVRVGEEGIYKNIHEAFSRKVCREKIMEAAFRGELVEEALQGKPIRIECKLVSLNEREVKYKQVFAAVIFYVSLLAAIMFWERRAAAVFLGVVAMVLLGVMPYHYALESMELGLILFLIATMVIVGYLKESGFLRFISAKAVMLSRGDPRKFLLIILVLSFALAALVNEVSSIVYVSLLILEVSEILGLNPIPWLLVAVFATNAGSAATMIGNPIGIYIGLYFEKTFADFLVYATPAALAALGIIYVLAHLYLKTIGEFDKMLRVDIERIELDPWAEVKSKSDFYFSIVIFVLMILGIALHVQIADLLNTLLAYVYGAQHVFVVTPEAALVLVPILLAGIVLARAGYIARKLVEERVEWWALIFFMFLFSLAAGLSITGVTDILAYAILLAVGGGLSVVTGYLANLLIMVTTAVASGFIDNMPIIVALSPVAKTLMSVGIPGAEMLPWSLLLGGTLGGNLTIIGSTANIVAVGIAEKRGFRIGFRDWIKIGAVTVLATLISSAIWVALFVFKML